MKIIINKLKNMFSNHTLIRFLSYGSSSAIIFLIFKTYYIIQSGCVLSEILELPSYIKEDVMMSVAVGVGAIFSSIIAEILIFAFSFSYIFSIFYALIIGNFMDVSVYKYSDDLSYLMSSIRELWDWKHALILGLVLVFHRKFISKTLHFLRSLDDIWIKSMVMTLLCAALLIQFIPVHPNERDFGKNPIYKLMFNHQMNSKKPDKAQELGKILNFDEISSFPRPPDETFSDSAPLEVRADKTYNLVLVGLESTGSVSRIRANDETMPNFKKLTENGIYWDNVYAPVPKSIKSIFSYLTGHYSGASDEDVTDVRPRFPAKTLADYFKSDGYRTALLHSGHFSYTNKSAFLKDRGFDLLLDAKNIPKQEIYEHNSWGVDDKAMYEYAKKWVSESDDPFFLTMIPLFPHHPYNVPKGTSRKFPEMTRQDKYHNSLYYHDGLLGDFIDYLKKIGKYEKTVFVVFGDHGEAFEQHFGNRIHGTSVYEEDVRVPLVISNPNLFKDSLKLDSVGMIPDIMPTVLDLFGKKNEKSLPRDGSSLFDLPKNRIIYLFTYWRGNVLGLRDGRYKFIYYPDEDKTKLFDLVSDPGEKTDISYKNKDRQSRYLKYLQDWREYSNNKIANYYEPDSRMDKISLTEYPIYFVSQDYGRLKYNTTVDGKKFKIAGKIYNEKGFGTHAASIITFDISDLGERYLSVKFGRDEESVGNNNEKAACEIWVDGKTVIKSKELSSQEKPVHIFIPVSGEKLSLVATETSDGGWGDHVDWLEPILYKSDIRKNE